MNKPHIYIDADGGEWRGDPYFDGWVFFFLGAIIASVFWILLAKKTF